MSALFANPAGPFPPPSRARMVGVYPALVTDVADEKKQARVEVEFPWVDEEAGPKTRTWARLATLMAGADRGSWFVPEKGDEVLVAFMAGDPRWPVVVGSLWNGEDAPPEEMDGGGENHIRSITSESGHRLAFHDEPGKEKFEVETQGGHIIRLEDEPGKEKVTVRHSNGAEITIDEEGSVMINALKEVVVTAAERLVVRTPEVLVESPSSKFTGTIECVHLQSGTIQTGAINSGRYNNAPGNLV